MPNGHYHPDVDDYVVEMWDGGYILESPPWRTGVDVSFLEKELGVDNALARHGYFSHEDFLAQRERFPEGQFIGDRRAANFGLCITMLTSRSPDDEVLPWLAAIGDNSLAAHEPDGDWLYMVQLAVHPTYRRHGMASAFIRACVSLAVLKNLRGIYVVPLLTGYRQFSDRMNVEDYASEVIWGKIADPLVSLFLKRGFSQGFAYDSVVNDHFEAPNAADSGVLLSWTNHRFDQDRSK